MAFSLATLSQWLSPRRALPATGLRPLARHPAGRLSPREPHPLVDVVRRALCDITCPRVIQRKPTTPSNRHTALTDKSKLYKGRPHLRVSVALAKRAGRSSLTGRITVRHQGGGNKRLYRIIDFKRSACESIPGVVQRIEYDPNRSALIALVRHQKKCPAVKKTRSLCVHHLPNRAQDRPDRYRRPAVDVNIGNTMTLRHVPAGTVVPNINL